MIVILSVLRTEPTVLAVSKDSRTISYDSPALKLVASIMSYEYPTADLMLIKSRAELSAYRMLGTIVLEIGISA